MLIQVVHTVSTAACRAEDETLCKFHIHVTDLVLYSVRKPVPPIVTFTGWR